MQIRLQKILAEAGVASRRKCEEIITAGRVTVNGVLVVELGAKATAEDEITVDGIPLSRKSPQKTYIALHKPQCTVTTVTDQFGRATVMDYVPKNPRLFPVGRLDYETSGILLLTNDGDWANVLTHPKHEVRKTYIATVSGEPTERKFQTFREGITIDNRKTAPAEIEILQRDNYAHNNVVVRIVIREGRNRQVRKMCEAIGHPVITLKREAIGNIQLGDLPLGKWRNLTEHEINSNRPVLL